MNKDYQELKAWLDSTKDTPLETMAGFFDARINDYEEHMSHWANHYKWMSELLPSSTQELLDIGCGSGLELDCIFSRFPHIQVTGIDLSTQMLARLHQKHSDKKLSLICGDYFLCDLGKEKFDVAVSFETLHHFTVQRKTALFEKIYRCLKPGGIYLECDYIATSQEIEDLTFSECQRRRKRDGFADDIFVHFDTPLTLDHEMKAMKDAGFQKVELIGYLPEDDHTPMIKATKIQI